MTDQLPDPLVPPEVDLRDFQYMELDVRALRDSRFAAEVKPEAFRAGVLLWCAAWHQVPAGSLPDDDVQLATLAGYGFVVREWCKVRTQALQLFVRCSDGRLYHRVIAEKALAAWEAKCRHQYDRLCDRARKANKQREAQKVELLAVPSFEDWKSAGRPAELPAPTPPPSAGNPPENALRGNGTEQNGTETLFPPYGGGGAAQSATPPTAPPTPPPTPPPPPPAFDGLNAEQLNGKAVVALAEDFDLPAQWGLDAEALGFKPAEVHREAEKFRQFFVAGRGAGTRRSVRGWRQSWSNWLGKAAKEAQR